MLSRVSLRLRVPLQRVSFSTKFTVNDVRNQQQKRIPSFNVDPAFLRIYEKGIDAFGIGGFVFAIAFSAALAFDDAKRNKNFSATVHVLNLFNRLLTFPIFCGVLWPLILVGTFGYNFYASLKICWKAYLRRTANHKCESVTDK